MPEYRIVSNDPNYEIELAIRQYASCKFLVKLFLFIGLGLFAISLVIASKECVLLSLLSLAIAIYKFIQGAYVKSVYRL